MVDEADREFCLVAKPFPLIGPRGAERHSASDLIMNESDQSVGRHSLLLLLLFLTCNKKGAEQRERELERNALLGSPKREAKSFLSISLMSTTCVLKGCRALAVEMSSGRELWEIYRIVGNII